MSLKLFDKILSVSINEEQIRIAREFAKAVSETVNYADSNQTIKEKIKEDHFISKIGEEAVATVFKKYRQDVEGPDYTIYLGDYKSWDCDLRINGVEVAVKTQTSANAKKYELSWTFQSSGKRRDPILANPEAWVVFVECNENNFECRVFPPKQIKELTLSDPKLVHLKGMKKVYYA